MTEGDKAGVRPHDPDALLRQVLGQARAIRREFLPGSG